MCKKFTLVSLFLILFKINGYLCISHQPKLIVIAFDGFRYDYMRKTETPNLDYLLEQGVTVPWVKSSFVSKTYTNFQSIVTGLWPESHGIIDNYIWDFQKNLTWKDEEFYNGYSDDVIPIWLRNEWFGQDRKSGVILWPGSVFGFGQNRSLVSHLVHYEENLPFSWRVDQGINWFTDEVDPINFLMLYFEEPDYVGHTNGPDSPQIIEIIKKLDDIVGYLIERLKEVDLFDQVNIIFCADHGMQEVNVAKGVIDISNFTQYFERRVGSSPVWFIKPLEGKLELTYEALKTYSIGKFFKVYKKENLPKSWHISQNKRILPLVIVAEPGWVFHDKQNANLTTIGVHGYDNESPYMRPFFLGYGPRFKKGFVGQPFENIDLFPLMCEILEINEPPNNGSLARTMKLLQDNEIIPDTDTDTDTYPNIQSDSSKPEISTLIVLLNLFRIFAFLCSFILVKILYNEDYF